MNQSILPTQESTIKSSHPITAPGEYLGPATILRVEPERVYLECPDAVVWAELATGFFYHPAEGDRVLAITRGSSWYVIGVLNSGDVARVIVPGSLEISAPAGTITLRSNEDVEIKSRKFRIRCKEFEVASNWIWQRCDELVQKVRGKFRHESESCESLVAGEVFTKAGRIRHTADGDIKLRGKTINLN